ncbi:hypothetical protein ACS0TY_024917 [Phlomoides rotata]
MGFYGPARCGFYRLDHHLITALVERWHPETHTFHFPVGEVTVTLQDVAIIWGLYIEGEPVICAEPQHTKRQWREYCDQMLGFHPQEGEMRTTTSILMSALRERMLHMPAIHDQTPQEDVDKYARGCALLLLGTLMMPDTSRCAVSLLYLHFLEDVTTAHNYSWGSAVLARLYRELCTATQSGAKPIGGAMSLLQVNINLIQLIKYSLQLYKFLSIKYVDLGMVEDHHITTHQYTTYACIRTYVRRRRPRFGTSSVWG